MTYLSRLVLNLRDRSAQLDLADCRRLHCTILGGFPHVSDEAARAALGVLYRVEFGASRPHILVQSSVVPDWSALHPGYLAQPPETQEIDGVYAALHRGQQLRFRLRANPTKRVLRQEGWVGKRINLQREADQIAWLERKGLMGGFGLCQLRASGGVPSVQAASEPAAHGRREGRTLTFGSVQFDGELRVVDADLFRETLLRGIGSGKAYGFGLLSIAPVGG